MSGHATRPESWSEDYDWPSRAFMTKSCREPIGFSVEPHGDDEQSDANAHLIGDLLEVARNFIRWAESPADDAVGMAREQEWLNAARAAINRADGGGALRDSAAEGADNA